MDKVEFNTLEDANAYINKWSNVVINHCNRTEYMKIYQRNYQNNNRISINEKLRKKYELNKDKINEKCRQRRKNRTVEEIENTASKKKEYYYNVVAPKNKEKKKNN